MASLLKLLSAALCRTRSDYLVRKKIEGRINGYITKYEGIAARTQIVAGTNYLFKVDIGIGVRHYVHIKVFVPPFANEEPVLENFWPNKTKDDKLEEEPGGRD